MLISLVVIAEVSDFDKRDSSLSSVSTSASSASKLISESDEVEDIVIINRNLATVESRGKIVLQKGFDTRGNPKT